MTTGSRCAIRDSLGAMQWGCVACALCERVECHAVLNPNRDVVFVLFTRAASTFWV